MVNVALDAVEDGFGETKLSREKAVRHESWIELEKLTKKKRPLSV
ncbi:30S ribosomal protein S1 [Rodentibacter pneumotropicus]|uniref:30S ribosomal protein S1 n=1 Tax=Rodentibacter pneumotropicus TaxID=758 RepID=A0A3S4W1H9_9PAST|nr:30S ribosomal protein S1 [Rodentibacter pneumotropicus]